MGNGKLNDVKDLVYVKVGQFDKSSNANIALDIEKMNIRMRTYVAFMSAGFDSQSRGRASRAEYNRNAVPSIMNAREVDNEGGMTPLP